MSDTTPGTAQTCVEVIAFPMFVGVVLIVIVVALWEPLIITPLINALVLGYGLSGNVGLSVLILSAGIGVWHLLMQAPKFRFQQRMLEFGAGGEALSQGQPVDFSKLLSLYLPGVLASVVRLVVYVGLIWVFWNVLSPESEVSLKLHRFLWTPLDPLAESFDAHFAYLDLRDRDLAPVPWLPFPLPGAFVLVSAILGLFNTYITGVIKERHWPGSVSKWVRRSTLCAAPLGAFVFGLIFPSGVVLYGIGAQCLSLIELWLFPLAVASD